MASAAEVIRKVLVDQGLVILPQIPGRTIPYVQLPGSGLLVCFVSSMPDDFDQAVSICDMSGRMLGRQMDDGQLLVQDGLCFHIRVPDQVGYIKGFEIARTIYGACGSMANITTMLLGFTYAIANVIRTSTIISLGEETGKKRMLWTFNARVKFQNNQPVG